MKAGKDGLTCILKLLVLEAGRNELTCILDCWSCWQEGMNLPVSWTAGPVGKKELTDLYHRLLVLQAGRGWTDLYLGLLVLQAGGDGHDGVYQLHHLNRNNGH